MSESVALPVSAEERLHHVDTLRGIALLGVLMMNLHEWFRAPMQMYRGNPHPWGGWWNVITDTLLETLVSGKALSTFAMLFAVGLCIQSERVLARGGSFKPYAFRRLGVLFVFGVLHILLVWNGDILHNYAIVGLLALPFLHRKPKTIFIWLGCILGGAALALLVVSIIMALKPTSPFGGRTAAGIARTQTLIQEMLQIRGHGSWKQEFFFRLKEYTQLFGWRGEIGNTLDIFIKFLMGLAIWKAGILRDPAAHLTRIRRFFFWIAPIALICVAISHGIQQIQSLPPQTWRTFRWFLPLIGFSQVFGTLAMALAWGSGALLLLQRPAAQRVLSGFTAIGRMALTNYLTQSIVMTTLFFGWGLGLYGKLSPFTGVCISVTFFAAQVAFSRWWLSRHAFGPMEWLWRTLTYGRRPGRTESVGTLDAEPTTAS